jgi:hypothetical protein
MIYIGRSLLAVFVFLFAVMAGTAQAQTFKIVQWNIQSGKGINAMSGGNDKGFSFDGNCDSSLGPPKNAWGAGATQKVITDYIKNDLQVVAFVVNEAWGGSCARPEEIKKVLNQGGGTWVRTGNPGDTGEKEGVAVFARYGFASTPTFTKVGDDTAVTDNRYVWRAAVWVDALQTQSFVIYGTHLDGIDDGVPSQGSRLLGATLNDRNGHVPHAIVGDLNTKVATQGPAGTCGTQHALTTLTTEGYAEAWPLISTGNGYTATLHNGSCGDPVTGAAWKRIDLLMVWGSGITVNEGLPFMTPPDYPVRDDLPSDHYGVKYRLTLGCCDTEDPVVSFVSPTDNQNVGGNVSVSVTATDNVGVTSVDLTRDAIPIHSWTSGPYTYTWDSRTVGDGPHTLQATAHDAAGHSAQRTITVNVSNPPPPADWTAVVNATVTGSTLQKTAGCEGCLDSGAISVNTIASGDGYVQFTPSFEKRLTAGLGTNRTNSTGLAEINFAFSIWPDRTWDIRENNTYITGGTHTLGDVFKVAIENGVVKYYRNGGLVYTSTVAPTYPIGLDVCILSMSGTVSNPSVFSSGGGGPITSDVMWINAVNATPYDSTLQKTSGCTECDDGGGISQQTIVSGDGSIEFTPSFQHRFYAGLGTDRSASTSRALINYAFTFWLDPTWDIRENDSYKTGGSYVSGDVFKIAIQGGVVKYYKNGGLVYTSTVAPTYPLGLDTSMLTVGSTVGSAKITR